MAYFISFGGEEWKDIPGYEGRYCISTHGRVGSYVSDRVLTPMRTGSSRRSGRCCKVDLQGTVYSVAALVLTTFAGPRPHKNCVMHLDDDPSNNWLDNLQWGSSKDNARDMARKGRGGNQILTSETVSEIRRLRCAGVQGKVLAKMFGVSQQRICDIYKGRTAL